MDCRRDRCDGLEAGIRLGGGRLNLGWRDGRAVLDGSGDGTTSDGLEGWWLRARARQRWAGGGAAPAMVGWRDTGVPPLLTWCGKRVGLEAVAPQVGLMGWRGRASNGAVV